jgi:hypothetical protein
MSVCLASAQPAADTILLGPVSITGLNLIVDNGTPLFALDSITLTDNASDLGQLL